VGYFVLGPSDLYALVKEVGKFVQNVRSLGTEATKTFENTMDSQLELKEIRKAQQELTDAFSFRRSINVDQDAEVFSNSAAGPEEEVTGMGVPESAVPAAAAAEGATAEGATVEEPKKKKKKRRRVKKRQPEAEPTSDNESTGAIPDLDM
jgi:Sec-independent protein translocase protein TatA